MKQFEQVVALIPINILRIYLETCPLFFLIFCLVHTGKFSLLKIFEKRPPRQSRVLRENSSLYTFASNMLESTALVLLFFAFSVSIYKLSGTNELSFLMFAGFNKRIFQKTLHEIIRFEKLSSTFQKSLICLPGSKFFWENAAIFPV